SATSSLAGFWNDMQEALLPTPGPGGCKNPEPGPRRDSPVGAPIPDCESAGGCLFCEKNRDIRSFDHAWNLATLKELKLLELNADRAPLDSKKVHPVAVTIERISAKLEAMRAVGSDCEDWVTEATTRVQEGLYHPFYTSAFQLLEVADVP